MAQVLAERGDQGGGREGQHHEGDGGPRGSSHRDLGLGEKVVPEQRRLDHRDRGKYQDQSVPALVPVVGDPLPVQREQVPQRGDPPVEIPRLLVEAQRLGGGVLDLRADVRQVPLLLAEDQLAQRHLPGQHEQLRVLAVDRDEVAGVGLVEPDEVLGEQALGFVDDQPLP